MITQVLVVYVSFTFYQFELVAMANGFPKEYVVGGTSIAIE